MTSPRPAAVVTGASTGIGHACTTRLVAEGWQVFAGVRKPEDGERLREELGERVTPLIMDVTDAASLNTAADQVRQALDGQTLKGLVNNAGIAVAGPMLDLDVEDFQRQMDVNVTGVVRATQAFGPLLGVDEDLDGGPGRIVMMSSVAGEMGAPFLGPYAASKHAVEGISKSLRRELMLYGIEVVVIGPGAVATPIWDKAQDIDPEPYRETRFYDAMLRIRDWMTKNGPEGFPPSKIADRVFKALTQDKPRFRYAIVPQRLTNWSLQKMLPGRMVNNMVAKRVGLERKYR
ncbi:MAG: SDR family oxidoreductase [Alphaproteobacteria bacterium]|uniref:SDR family oxidoreductase n=1 Tax=Maricaulis alexandrii TaxID=2570354 RepID=UPI0011097469|nr:SDR family oxidoreductase [Maricaulis alexandrii]MCR9266582.1 SDR family oxidoreductase [Alphaproteobacteria bacterium]